MFFLFQVTKCNETSYMVLVNVKIPKLKVCKNVVYDFKTVKFGNAIYFAKRWDSSL